MLKSKVAANYRRATERFKRCKYCVCKKWVPIHTIGGQVLRHDWRCEIIGLQNSRRYSVQDNHVCDHHEQNGGSGNIIPDRFSETGERCLMCGTEPANPCLPTVMTVGKPERKEETMSRGQDYPCKKLGCTRGGFFHGYCKRHFPEAYGVSWEDYLKNRAFKGEKPHLVAARLQTVDVSKLILGENVAKTCENEKLDTNTAASGGPAIIPGGSNTVTFPEDLWDKVSELAEKEFRTPTQQILYIVQQALGGRCGEVYVTLEPSDEKLRQRMMRLISTDPGIRSVLKGC